MKRRLISFLLLIMLIISGCGLKKNNINTPVYSQSTDMTNPPIPSKSKVITSNQVKGDKNLYTISVELDIENKVLTGHEMITYVNKESNKLDDIYFHIYPNAYKSKGTLPVAPENYSQAYSSGFKPGYIDIIGIKDSDKKLDYSIKGIDDTILKVNLDKPLEPDESIDIFIDFKITIPPVSDRLGYMDGVFNFGNWYPIAAVIDNTGWNLDPYYAMGDPFYSDVSDYIVNITVPKNYIVASTGENMKSTVKGNKRTYTFKENSVRDFAWVTSSKFKVDKKTVDGINIWCYTLESDSNKRELALASAINSIKVFNNSFGKYPYKNFSVVSTNFISGMEYPGIVFINKDYYKNYSDEFYLEVTIAHEAAHQWWYAVVGNDEIDEAWIDESLASYSEVVYYEKLLGSQRGNEYFEIQFLYPYTSYKGRFLDGEKILRSVPEFKSTADYALLVYYKGAIMLNAIRDETGDVIFYKILKTFYEKYKFKNATTDNFISVVELVTNKQWDDFFDEWLMNK